MPEPALYAFQDPELDVESRVQDLLQALTLEEKLALLEVGMEGGGRVGRGRGPQAMDDMLYGSSADSANMGKTGNILSSENLNTGNLTHPPPL